MPDSLIIQGDARHIPLANESVQCVVTSPPYWGLRDYKLKPRVWDGREGCEHAWGEEVIAPRDSNRDTLEWTTGGDPAAKIKAGPVSQGSFCPCGAWLGSLGLEPTPDLYVQHIVEIFREVRRVLRKDGTCWVNMGDSYASGELGRHDQKDGKRADYSDGTNNKGFGEKRKQSRLDTGLKPKDLIGIPWRVAFALQADGWWLRSDIIWAKPNPMPESVMDRPTRAHEYLFLLTKSEKYYWDQEAVREAHVEPWRGKGEHESKTPHSGRLDTNEQAAFTVAVRQYNPNGRNIRTVWTIATQPFPEAHFATFPEKLVEPCVLAGTSEFGCCSECGAAWDRMVESPKIPDEMRNRSDETKMGFHTRQLGGGQAIQNWRDNNPPKTAGWCRTCNHDTKPIPCTVLDPFAGSGTVGVVCARLNRRFVGIELSEEYCSMARKRIAPYAAQAHLPLGG